MRARHFGVKAVSYKIRGRSAPWMIESRLAAAMLQPSALATSWTQLCNICMTADAVTEATGSPGQRRCDQESLRGAMLRAGP